VNGRKSIGAVHRVVGLVVLLCLSVHCAARGPALTTSESTSLDRADALVRDGCYGCLRLASETYESLIDRPSRRLSARVLRGLFDVTLLLAVREKEIGLAADASLARARALLSGLVHVTMSERTGPLPHLKMLLEAAEAVVGDSSGLDAGERAQTEGGPQRRIARPPLSDVHEALQTLAASDLVAGYLALALDCGVRRNLPSIGRDSSPAINDSPLMRYRVAICSSTQPTALTQLRDEDPRWMEAFFFEGKYEMGSPARSADPLRAAAFLTHAREAFPDSIAIHVMLARAQEMNGEFAGALASFDNVVRDAMRLLANTSVYALAGSIAYARRDLDMAVHHFNRALEMDSTNCAAASSAGLVHRDQRAWQPAADKYSKATNCFIRAANTARAELAKLEQSELEPSSKATRRSSAQKRTESADELSGQSALRAAQRYVLANQKTLAVTYIELAERYPSSRAEALALRARIGSMK